VAVGFPIGAAGVQHSALLERRLRYVALTAIDLLSLVASVSIGIGMALSGFEYWSIVGMTLASTTITTICLWVTTGWVPRMPSRAVGVRSMLVFGGTVTLNGLVIYLAYNLDKVLLGRYWGANELGLYERPYRLLEMPLVNLNAAIGGVAFSALSRLQDEPERFKNYFLKGYSVVTSMTLPTIAFCGLFAEDVVLVALGPKWADAAVTFRLLAPAFLVLAMINPTSWLLLSTGRQARSLAIALVMAPVVMTAFVIGLPHGRNGMAFAFSTAMALWLVPHIIWALYDTMISPRDLLGSLMPQVLSIIVAAAVAWAFRTYYGQLQPPFFRLALEGGIMVGTYLWMLMFIMGQKTLYRDLFRQLQISP
jgi:O-antigen/teichoic acid export membrane protein